MYIKRVDQPVRPASSRGLPLAHTPLPLDANPTTGPGNKQPSTSIAGEQGAGKGIGTEGKEG